DDWRTRLAFVPQRAFLFSESLKENVLLGAPDDGRLERVLRLAALDVDIAALPAGVHTVVGESGLMLSGGQRQRTALARGLVRAHTVLVLDDVLSAVDHETERQLIESLRNAGVTPTTVIVSHRISALQHAHQIAVFRHGRVVEVGTHEALVQREGFYRATWDRQREGDES
ncbi:MAG: ABC transporter ATP-binding protein, partial [Deltaproteobacteria bacterium]|nr:ABC transporter ATP-binding protein [Deltaproteobacteria bacterium]